MCLQAMLIPVILEISSMSLNSEASHVSFLNRTLLQIENYIKNGQPSFQCQCLDMFYFLANGSGSTLSFVWIILWLWNMNSAILKHVSVFALKQLVARILSNKYIWLLLKYKTTDVLGTYSDLRRKTYPHNSLSWRRVKTIALSSDSIHCFRQFK